MQKRMLVSSWTGTVLAACSLLFLAGGCGGDKAEEARKHFEMGVQYFQDQKMDDALAELQEAVRLDPKLLDARYNLGGVYQLAKAYSQAIEQYEAILRLDPSYPRIHTAFANVYYELGLTAWGRAVKLDRVRFWFPDTLRELPYEDRAGLLKLVDQYLVEIRADTVDAETVSKLSQAYFILAAEEYEKAVQADAADTSAQLYLGLTYSEQGYRDRAMAQYEILKKLSPNTAELLLAMLTQKDREKERREESKKGGG